MFVWPGRGRAHIGLPAIQAGLLWLAVKLGHGPGVTVCLALFLGTSLVGWQRALRHGRQIGDIPTSRVASAAQGYTELRGRGQPLAGTPVLSLVNGLPVLWYRVVTMRRNGQNKGSEEHTSELSHQKISYAVFCLKKKKKRRGYRCNERNGSGGRTDRRQEGQT